MLQALHVSQATIKWLWVPSQAGIEGNICADSLADHGREWSPLVRVASGHAVATLLALLNHMPTPPRLVDRQGAQHAIFTPVVLDITSPLAYIVGIHLCEMVVDGELDPSKVLTYYDEEDGTYGELSTENEGTCFEEISGTHSTDSMTTQGLETEHISNKYFDSYIQ